MLKEELEACFQYLEKGKCYKIPFAEPPHSKIHCIFQYVGKSGGLYQFKEKAGWTVTLSAAQMLGREPEAIECRG